jgi:hypothetical protein
VAIYEAYLYDLTPTDPTSACVGITLNPGTGDAYGVALVDTLVYQSDGVGINDLGLDVFAVTLFVL